MTVTASSSFDELIDAFPIEGTLSAKLRHLISFAVLAPSSHNSQPWLFKVKGDTVELYADRSRALSVVDPYDRELIMSCGAALHHLQLAAHEFGLCSTLELLPNGLDLLARLCFKEGHDFSKAQHDQFTAIAKRRTYRKAFEPFTLPLQLLEDLKQAVQKQAVWLEWFSSQVEKEVLAELIAEADQLQWHDRSFRSELASWSHANRSRSKDGMPGYALGLNDISAAFSPLIIRTFDIGGGQAAKDKDLALASPVLGILGTQEDTPEAWLKTGQALSELLLKARAENVFASFLNQPIEVAELRQMVAKIARHDASPQLILRLGFGCDIPATPRRDAHEVLI